jgi:hypothetical protein
MQEETVELCWLRKRSQPCFSLLSEPLNVLIQTLPALVSAYACFARIGDFLHKDSRQDMRDCTVSIETSDGTSSNL